MERIRVVLCYTASDTIAGRPSASQADIEQMPATISGIRDVLRGIPSIDIVATIEKAKLEDVLRLGSFKVLILPAGHHSDSDYQRFLDTRPDIGILLIDLLGYDTVLRFRDVDSEMLVRMIKTLAEDRAVRAPDSRIQRLGRNDLHPRYRDADDHLTDVKQWIALSLKSLLRARRPSVEEKCAPVPSWTMTAEQGEQLLDELISSIDATPEKIWQQIETREKATSQQSPEIDLRLMRIAASFELEDADAQSPESRQIEKKLVWHVLGPELDGRLARVHGFLNDDLSRRRPTLTTLAQLLDAGQDGWSLRRLLAGERPLARYRLVSVHAEHSHGMPATEDSVAPAPELIDFLLNDGERGGGAQGPGVTLQNVDLTFEPDAAADPAAQRIVEQLRTTLGSKTGPMSDTGARPIFELAGGREALAWLERTLRATGTVALKIDLGLQPDLNASRFVRAAEGWARLAILHRAVLLVTGFEQRSAEARSELGRACAEHLPDLVPAIILHGAVVEAPADHRPVRLIDHSKLSMRTRARLWAGRAGAAGLRLSEEGAQRLAAMARFDEAQIDLAIGIAKGLPEDGANDDFHVLCAAVLRLAREGAPSAVQVVECTYGWGDIVLPQEVMDRLQDLANQVRFSSRVREDWKFDRRMPYGRGVAALFSGPSGTGKSMAAQIIACDLCSALYRIDLSKTVSKWLGETEKILSQIFDLAQRNSATLFFDEADVLFAKRTEVKDAHDRYANVEVAYLLQRMEDYDGLAILTTNLKQNIDPAFLRRLRFVIDFPMPDASQRERIWKLAFPKGAPLAGDIDFELLARRLPLSGGNIQQIAIGAAFIAAAAGSATITMQHILRATRQELLKLGMVSAERGLAEVVLGGDQPAMGAVA